MQVLQTRSRIPVVQAVVPIPIDLKPSKTWIRLSDAARELNIGTGTLSHWASRNIIASKTDGNATLLNEGETKTIVGLHRKYGKRAGRMFRERGFIHLSQPMPVQLPPEFAVSSL